VSDWLETHLHCDDCGSSDGRSINSAGWSTCFVCNERHPPSGERPVTSSDTPKDVKLVVVRPCSWGRRKLTEETLRAVKIGSAEWDGRVCMVYNYYRDSVRCGQQLDFGGGEYLVLGDLTKRAELFLQDLWKPGGRQLVIIEGPKDAAAFYQITGGTIPVVSPPNGAGTAAESCRRWLEWIETFEKVVILFDNDEPGREGALKLADLLTPGKAWIATTPLKDTGDMLMADRGDELPEIIRQAKPYRPGGIVAGAQITTKALRDRPAVVGYKTGIPLIDETMRGLRKREITMLGSGSGMGKSALTRQITHGLCRLEENRHPNGRPLKVGNIYLEDSQWEDTAEAFVALDNKVPREDILLDRSLLPEEAYDTTTSWLREQMVFYDHFGSLDSKDLLSRMRFMALGEGCDFIAFDHISIAVSGMPSSREGERKDFDILMTALRSLVNNTGVGIILVSHLKNPDQGKTYEEGRRVTLNDFRGSGSLKQISDNVIGLEGDQQGDAPNQRTLRLLKQRLGGINSRFGPTVTGLRYDPETGLILPDNLNGVTAADFEDPNDGVDVPF
jgi:twinkle protein